LDGKTFHTFTKGLKRPYDEGLSELMIATTKFLVEETNAVMGYTQSDEISLLLYQPSYKSSIYMSGRSQKINSVLAAKCSTFFSENLGQYLPAKDKLPPNKRPVFDCRCFNVPDKFEAVNAFLWREQDATRNSVSMAGQSMYSHKQLQNKSRREIQDLLHAKDVNWNDYPTFFKRGTYVQKKTMMLKSEVLLSGLPEKHNLRKNPELMVERKKVVELELKPLSKVLNKIEVFFEGEDAIYE
jgi:tRNA(His) 5'-end guanylyltransferase